MRLAPTPAVMRPPATDAISAGLCQIEVKKDGRQPLLLSNGTSEEYTHRAIVMQTQLESVQEKEGENLHSFDLL